MQKFEGKKEKVDLWYRYTTRYMFRMCKTLGSIIRTKERKIKQKKGKERKERKANLIIILYIIL